jgi:hypothetical protein
MSRPPMGHDGQSLHWAYPLRMATSPFANAGVSKRKLTIRTLKLAPKG